MEEIKKLEINTEDIDEDKKDETDEKKQQIKQMFTNCIATWILTEFHICFYK